MASALPTHTHSVLIVDDEPDSLRMLTQALEGAELNVLVATSGTAALALIEHFLPDLIIMDAVMPGMDGFETTARIKRRPELAHVPVIFMTGLTESEHVVEAFEVGGVDYVRKPVNLVELIARVRVHISQGRAVQASVASLDATGRLMIATDAKGRMLWCTPRAEQAITRLVPEWRREGEDLPPLVGEQVERLLSRGGGKPGVSTKIEQGGSTLELVVMIRLNEAGHDLTVAKLRAQLDLTQREAEVLLWVGYGKASNDISDVLSISPRTVQKHLERIYVKLGVEKRSAAAAIAIRVIEQ